VAGAYIAIIDDDDSMRSALVALVRSAGYAAQGFGSAEEFLADGNIQSFACLITDIQMPGMSGIELNERLTATGHKLPTIMITARHDAGLEERAMAGGALCFLRKPLEADALMQRLEEALTR
jgi:FixJ family two-component response regulator